MARLILCLILLSSCGEYASDATRPDIQHKAKKEQRSRLLQYGDT